MTRLRALWNRIPKPSLQAEAYVRVFIAVALAALCVLALVSFVLAEQQAQHALNVRDDVATRATHRIDALTEEIHKLEDSALNNGSRIGELVTEVNTLRRQLEAAHVSPIVPEERADTTTTKSKAPAPPSSLPAPAPSSSPTTSTTRPPSTTTTTRPRTCVGPLCI